MYRRIIEAKIRAEVDDAHRQIGKRSRDLHRVSVRQADKDEIAVLADGPDVLHALELHVVESSQMRIKRGDRLARMAL